MFNFCSCRFEGLQRSTKIHQQPLLKPLVVEMTANLENVIEENLQVFEENGFKIIVDESAPAGERVSLLTMPFSKGTQFGVNDVLELASILCGEDGDDFYEGRTSKNYLSLRNEPVSHSDKSYLQPRILLPKIMTMFASRACRSAVMIGTALSKTEMRTIVQQMVSVEQPWNCPHGRPTMRHLFDYIAYQQQTQEELNHPAVCDKVISHELLDKLDFHLRASSAEDDS